MLRLEQMPYGVKDFKRIRLENFYYGIEGEVAAKHAEAWLEEMQRV